MATKKKQAKDDPRNKVVATNRKARYDYTVLDVFEAGIALQGTEVKALREGKASLVDAYATIDDGEVWLHALHIPEYGNGSWTNHSARRQRKMLLHRHELDKLISSSNEAGHTIVPLRLYFKDGKVKVEIALAKGKKQYDKRHALREKQETAA